MKEKNTPKNKTIYISCTLANEIEKNYLNLTKRLDEELTSLGYNIIYDNYQETNENNSLTNFERIKNLYELADIIIFLPGGTKNLSDLFSIIEENKLNPNPKDIILLNYELFYEKIIDMINYCISKKFTDNTVFEHFKICRTEDEIFIYLKNIETQKRLILN